jgi:hypothetical protein
MYIQCCWKNKELFECCCCDLELERTLKDVKVFAQNVHHLLLLSASVLS